MSMDEHRWCFTWNNPPEDAVAVMKGVEDFTYVCMGLEKAPTTGTPHWQGYLELKARKRMTAMKKLIPGADGIHWTQARGTAEENKKYCSKGGTAVTC